MRLIILLTVTILLNYLPARSQVHKDSLHGKASTDVNQPAMKFEIPGSLKAEHKELHESLVRYTKLPGETGAAATEVAKLLHPHFIKEETYAMPLLGLLADLAKGQTTGNKKEAIAMADRLKTDLQEMLSEHGQIVKALQKLYQAAKDEHQHDVMHFTESLKLHAKTEEEVLYPAAILVGEFLKIKS